jgi:hypothetical protein
VKEGVAEIVAGAAAVAGKESRRLVLLSSHETRPVGLTLRLHGLRGTEIHFHFFSVVIVKWVSEMRGTVERWRIAF